MALQSSTFVNYPIFPELLPAEDRVEGRYRLHFARTREEVEAALRLRFEVFNLELKEGLERSYDTGLDEDRFDSVCHHLMVISEKDGSVVGTYRMQTAEMAAAHHGFYSAGEYSFDSMAPEVIQASVEVGRACVAEAHRNRMVLFMLWKGLAQYMQSSQKRYLFGCCSLTSQDLVEAQQVDDYLKRENFVHPDYRLPATADFRCDPVELTPEQAAKEIKLPKLFRTYLRFGALVCSQPAIDRSFKTIDWLVLFDVEAMGAASRAMFFS